MRLLKFCFSTLILISLISFSSCGGDEMCLVTVTSGEGGTATVSVSEVMAGDEVTLTATPESGYVFKCWKRDGVEVSKANPYTVIVNKDSNYQAIFEKEDGTGEEDNNGTGDNNNEGTTTPETGNYEFVDLGLSVKWATCNVGATIPDEYGEYFAWGEIETKDDYDSDNYKWNAGKVTTLTKYCVNPEHGNNGFVDNKTTLEPEDDVAHVKWGGSWRMPTKEEWRELCNEENCIWYWKDIKYDDTYKVNGIEIVSKINGNKIFLPAAGSCNYKKNNTLGTRALYWSSTLQDDAQNYMSWNMCYYTKLEEYDIVIDNRFSGLSVRPVCE
ncbi:MAG: hypothetical protein IKB57_07700 [Bacteroidaceae bacterium]|nr:hypothetical protein [Bacteroidaceae bacterium]